MRFALAFCLLATPALPGVAAVLDRHILPGVAAFTTAAQALDAAALEDCRPAALRPAWNAAMDAWMRIGHLRLGPQEQAALSIAFWPDSRNSGRRTLARMIAAQVPMGVHGDEIHQISAAARGLYALETLLYDPDFNRYDEESYSCILVTMLTFDLAAQAQALDTAWRGKFAPGLRSAGTPGNATFLSAAEAERALFTALHAGVEFNADVRLGQPLGTPDRPRPTRAENWRAGRSLRNVTLSMQALHEMAVALAGGHDPALDEAFDAVGYFAGGIVDPGFQDIGEPQARTRLESLQGAIRHAGAALIARIGEEMGVAPGFNALDGD